MDKDDDLHCSFCGKGKEEVRKLIAGGTPEPSAQSRRVLPPVYICDECVALCADVCSGGMTEIEVKLHRAMDWLVRAVIDVLHTPPPAYDEMPQNPRTLVTRVLEAVREGLMELEADQPYESGNETSEAALEEALWRAWQLIDEYRRVRAQARASRP